MIDLVGPWNYAESGALVRAMHAMRYRIFVGEKCWSLPENRDGLEVDQFDAPSTFYLIRRNDAGDVLCAMMELALLREIHTITFVVTQRVWDLFSSLGWSMERLGRSEVLDGEVTFPGLVSVSLATLKRTRAAFGISAPILRIGGSYADAA